MTEVFHSDSQGDESGLNPAGAARRRLLRAAGLGAAAGLVSLDWRRPLVRVGSLPVHAQGSAVELCAISVQNALTFSGSAILSIAISNATTTLGTSAEGAGNIYLSLSFAPEQTGTYVVEFPETHTLFLAGSVSREYGATCCEGTYFSSGSSATASATVQGVGSGNPVTLTVEDDGSCSADFIE